MKIALISRTTGWHRSGGMPNVFNDRAEALLREGHDVHVITTPGGTIPGHYNPHVLDAKSGGVWTLAFSDFCKRICDRLEPDIIHLDSLDLHHPFWIHYPQENVAITLHGFGMGDTLTKWNLYKLGQENPPVINWLSMKNEAGVLSRAGTVIAISKWEYRMLTDMYGLDNVKLVYNPIANYFFQPTTTQRLTDRNKFIMVSASQSGIRGVEMATRAAQKAGVKFEVISGVDRTCMPRVYDTAKALVLPTCFAQGYDLTVAEARARGCPAIMYATGSYYDEAMPWDMLVPPGNFNELVDVMHKWDKGIFLDIPPDAADHHKPSFHAANWLDAIMY